MHYTLSTAQLLTIRKIQEAVAEFYQLPVSLMTDRCRVPNVVVARHVAMALCRLLTRCGNMQIGYAFERDHSTVLFACNSIREQRQVYPKFEAEFNRVRQVVVSAIAVESVENKRQLAEA